MRYDINNVINNLDIFIKKNNIKSILDMPCGDFSWMQNLVKKNIDINYTGYDIVKDIIGRNNKKYSSNKINFFCRDIVNEKTFDNFDLIFIRDFFIHIDNESINRILINIKNSKVKFLACSNNNNESFNNDVIFFCNTKSKFKAKSWIFWDTKRNLFRAGWNNSLSCTQKLCWWFC